MGIAKGWQADLLTRFAEGGGYLSDDEAVKLARRTYSDCDRKQIMKLITPEISKLRKVIHKNMGCTGLSTDPLPRDKQRKGWQAAVQIGFAIKNDEDRLEFKLFQELSREERLDR